MQMDSGLGTLVVLPVELRYLIWEHISPSSGPFLACRTSSRICQSYETYKRRANFEKRF
jgi:hypothetical protein